LDKNTPRHTYSTASAGDLLLLMLLVAATSYLSLALTRVPSGVAAMWVSNGLVVGWLLPRPWPTWGRYLVAAVVAGAAGRMLAGDGLAQACALTFANLVEILIIAGTVHRYVDDVGNPARWLQLSRIATGSTLVACAVSGLLAASAVSLLGHASVLDVLVPWYPAHLIGMVLVATLTLVAQREGAGMLGRPGRRGEFALSMLLIALVVGAIFSQSRFPVLFLALPPLLWAAYRHRFAGVLIGIVLLAVISTTATALGHGPITLARDLSETERIFLVQVFIGTVFVLTYPLSLVMTERGRLAAKVRQSEAHYRMLADYSHDVVVHMRSDGQRLYVSPSSKAVLGWEPAEMLEPGMVIVHPDDRENQRHTIDSVIASGEASTATYRLRHKEGHYVWIEAVTRPIPSANNNGTMDVILAGRDIGERVEAMQQLEASQRELELLARADSLTGLANRRQFDERLSLALARSRRHGTPIALLYMDIDYFKRINDSLGHLAGDAVLKDFAHRLSACVRIEDLVARLGGDEFAMLVEDAATAEGAEVIARKLIGCVSRPSQVDGADTTITTSIGIAFCLRTTDAEELLWYADKALYVAKGNGRNTFHLVTME